MFGEWNSPAESTKAPQGLVGDDLVTDIRSEVPESTSYRQPGTSVPGSSESVDFQQLRRYRDCELQVVLPWLPAGASILEIGAGAGWQARALAEHGFAVQAIDVDVAGAGYKERREWPVTLYDGIRIPFADRCFDCVFSSNVLEHVPQVDRFQAEIKRVLKPGGVAVHVVPTGTWRWWTNLTYYPVLARRYLRKYLANTPVADLVGPAGAAPSAPVERDAVSKLKRIAVPARHGERGNCLTEVGLFSRPSWDSLFARTGWRIDACDATGLFYSGYFLLGSRLSMGTRHALSFVLGSSCLVYVLSDQAA
jgi:2-polyprenyl-3-methyl-5-hydroxy-6-metoxy-1,4-benzoquinol methylase